MNPGAVLQIWIRSDPNLLVGSGSDHVLDPVPDPDPTIKSHKTYKKNNKLNRYFCNITNKL